MKRLFLLSAFFVAALVRGEPIKLTRQQASDLYVALARIEPGLSAENVIVASDNLIALKATVDGLDKAKVAAQREMDLLPESAERTAKAWVVRDRLDRLCGDEVTIELTRFDISLDEIKSAKIKPVDLTPLRQFLRKR